MTAIVGLFAARRAAWLVKLTLSGQPATGALTGSACGYGPSSPRCSVSAGC
ncbi:putative IRON-SULFUR-BINDING REDUCTASE domain protein [Mycobacterium xenopi 3993]|nr:putative IRON-SULFUR-BINDING REDUCTASE domain protein [Mycobacterium xenopi 3993]